MRIRIIGGGLAGPEAALTAARAGAEVDLYEMRPVRTTPAHQTADFGELVCSNSLKSESENTAPWLLKQEMRRAGSPLLQCADASAVPAGHALAVDRVEFSRLIGQKLAAEPRITVHREEVTRIEEEDGVTIVASGPLTSSALSEEIARLTGTDHLAFYDSISPIVEADSIDREKVYLAARYDKGTADYINCPMTQGEYEAFHDALLTAESVEAKEWEKLDYFESCLPLEELARRGRDTLRFGPMKPVGLRDPRTGKTPWAVVQLRVENLRADSYNLGTVKDDAELDLLATACRISCLALEELLPTIRPGIGGNWPPRSSAGWWIWAPKAPPSTRSWPAGRTARSRTTRPATGRCGAVTWSRSTSAPGSAVTTRT